MSDFTDSFHTKTVGKESATSRTQRVGVVPVSYSGWFQRHSNVRTLTLL